MYYYHFSNEQYDQGNRISTLSWGLSKYWKNQLSQAAKDTYQTWAKNIVENLKNSLTTSPHSNLLVDRQIFQLVNSLVNLQLHSELLKEYIFEDVRLKEFPHLPNRKECIFLLEDCSQPEEKISAFGPAFLTKKKYRLTSKATSNYFHKADAMLLNCNSLTPLEMKQRAFQYWRGEPLDDTPQYEILGIGEFEIR